MLKKVPVVQLHLLTFILITYWIYLDQKVLTRVPATVLSLKMSCLSAIFGGDKKLHVLTHEQMEITRFHCLSLTSLCPNSNSDSED